MPPAAGASDEGLVSNNHQYLSVIPVFQGKSSYSHVAKTVASLTRGGSSDVAALEAAMATVITANVDSHDLTRNVEVNIYI